MARSLLIGTAVGAATRLVYLGPPDLMWLHKLGVPWLAAAFFVGMLRPSLRSGALHGAAALVAAVLVYYAMPVVVQGAPFANSKIGLAWLWVAVPGGAAFGLLGAGWKAHERWRLPTTALLVGAFLGEALLWYGRERPHVALAELCAAALLLGLLLPRNAQRLSAAAAALAIALMAAVAELGVYVGLGYLVG